MDPGLYFIFLVTTVMLILVPGPSAITVAAQGASYSPQKALFGVLGVAFADVIFFALSATGIASLIVASSVLFSLIKWVGVCYLLYLGMTALFSQSGAIRIEVRKREARRAKLFYHGLVVQLSNPKALLYFSALLPQFVDPDSPILMQMLVMGVSCFVADMVVYTAFSHLGDRLSKQQLKSRVLNWVNRAAGITLIFTGIRMATLDYTR